MTAIILGALLGGGIFFFWSAVSWMVLPWQRAVYQHFTDEDAVARVISSNAPVSGMYGLPREPQYPPEADKAQRHAIDQAAWDKMKDGPMVTAVIKYGGFAPFPRMLSIAFATYAVVAAFFCILLAQTTGLSYAERVGFIALAGLASGVICRVPDWNWHQYPLNHTLVQIANVVIGWALSGLGMAWLVRGVPA